MTAGLIFFNPDPMVCIAIDSTKGARRPWGTRKDPSTDIPEP